MILFDFLFGVTGMIVFMAPALLLAWFGQRMLGAVIAFGAGGGALLGVAGGVAGGWMDFQRARINRLYRSACDAGNVAKPILFLFLLLGTCLSAVAQDARFDPHQTFRLDNGLKVILRPLDNAQHIALVTLFAVGEDHDPRGQSGLGHLVEHVYVTAAAGGKDDSTALIKARTAQQFHAAYPQGANAQTGAQYTVVATVFPADRLEEELHDAAARMGQLTITEADLQREKPRILLEVKNMFGGIPRLAAMNFSREMVRPSPAGARKGGDPLQVKQLSLDAVRQHWRKYYKPANTVIVLAGRFDREHIRKQIETHFGSMPAGNPAPKPRMTGKPKWGQIQHITVKPIISQADSDQGYAAVAFTAPPPTDKAYPAFLLLAARSQTAARQLHPDPRQFPVYYAPVDMPETLYVIHPLEKDEEKNQETSPGAKTLEKVQTFVRRQTSRELTEADRQATLNVYGYLLGLREFPDSLLARNPYGVAFSLGRRAQMGMDAKRIAKAIESLTARDLQRCAKTYFAQDKSASVVVLKAGF